MKIFTIENETNNITVHNTIPEAEAVANAERFRNESGLNKLATDWPAARLVEIWNSLPGVSSVKKFKDRQTAVSRIWKALQSHGQAAPEAVTIDELASVPEATTATPAAPQTPDVAPEQAPATKKTTSRRNMPKLPKAAKSPEAVKAPRESSKTAQVVAMFQRPEGATLSEIMTYASHCTSLGRIEGFSLTKRLFDNLTPLFFCGGLGPGSS
ncbi:MAG: hypothetical protein WBW33_18315 [Bryobacteraceae bacterium]